MMSVYSVLQRVMGRTDFFVSGSVIFEVAEIFPEDLLSVGSPVGTRHRVGLWIALSKSKQAQT